MKNWSLRSRLTWWSAVFFAAAVSLLGVLTLGLVREHQIESLDNELFAEGRSFLHELNEHGPIGVSHAEGEIDNQSRAVVLINGKLEWRSPDWDYRDALNAVSGAQTIGKMRVVRQDKMEHTVILARGFEGVDATVADVRSAYLIALPVLACLVAAGAWWIVRSALRPVQVIGETAQRITAERLEARLPEPVREDEFGQLTRVLNEMLDRLDRGFQQATRFTHDASHEIKTPIALMRASIEELLRRRDLPPDVAASLASLLDDTRRLTSVCQDLLLLARADAGQLKLECEPQDLKGLIESAIDDARIVAEEAGITIEDDLPREATAIVDDRHLLRVLLGLFCNAVKYNRPGGTVKVALRRVAGQWELTVANTGDGVPLDHQDRLFERFFRVESTARRPGHGLGLSVSRELTRAQGGDLKLVSSDEHWTVFCLTLPRVEKAEIPEPRPALSQDAVASR